MMNILGHGTLIASSVVAALLLPPAVAHQRVYKPEPVYTLADRGTNWGPQANLEKQGYKTTSDFNAYLTANNYKNLRAFMDKPGAYKPTGTATFECGWTDPSAPARPIPSNGEMRSSGYTHDGPCEIWLDDVLVKSGKNCHVDIPTQSYTIDYSSCQAKGKCMLRWYWMGIRPFGSTYSWQIYKACVPLAANGGGGNNTSPAPTSMVPSPTPGPTRPAPAPSKDDTGNDDADPTPPTITSKPPATASAPPPKPTPTTSSSPSPSAPKRPKKCTRRRGDDA